MAIVFTITTFARLLYRHDEKIIIMNSIAVPVHDPTLMNNKFMFAHPHERIGLVSQVDDIYTLVCSKANISVRFGFCSNEDRTTLAKIFDVLMLYQVREYMRTHADSSMARATVTEIAIHTDVSRLQREVTSIVQSSKLRRLFCTTAHHFKESHGVISNMFRGYELYPPQPDAFFVPPVAMSRYSRDNMMFYNACHVAPVAFRTYDFKRFTTILDPSPLFEHDVNYAVREYRGDVFGFIPVFQYRSAERAKLSRSETNDINRYAFLVSLNDRYYRVLAIYPNGYVEKSFATLSPNVHLDMAATDVSKIVSHASSSEQTSQRLRLALGHNRFDELLAELEIVSLEEWLNVAVRPYVQRLTIIDGMVTSSSFAEAVDGDLTVYTGDGGFQFLLKTISTSFLYTQIDITAVDIHHVQVYYDRDAGESTTIRIMRLASAIRNSMRIMCRHSIISVFNNDDTDLHKQLFYLETRSARGLLDLDAICEEVIL
jgi:hypothetical protein